MNKTLFDEAVADAQRLKQLAEDTAKNRVIEAVMPQIRDLVNQRILGEMQHADEGEMPEMESLPDTLDDELIPAAGHDAKASVTISSGAPVDVEVATDGSVSVATDGAEINIGAESSADDDVLVLDQGMAEALSKLISGENLTESTPLAKKINTLSEKVKRLSIVHESVNLDDLDPAQKNRIQLSLLYCVREAIKLRTEVILTECTTQERLERRLTETIKEIKTMSKSNRRNIFDFLFEEKSEMKEREELEEAELSLELTDEEQEELAGAADPEAVGDALDAILSDLEVSLDAEEAEEAPAEEEEDEEEGEDELDLDEADMDEMSMKEREMEEAVYEIDENMLRRELRRMNEQEESSAVDAADQFGGGEATEEPFIEVDEDDLLNALADELGDVPEPEVGAAPSPTEAVAENRRRRRAMSSRRRSQSFALIEAKREIAAYKKAVTGLKSQLVEMNLFNAKLLYANKLMQNKNLTMKQQKAIVEALDNAKTLREAKLLFKSLSESLTRRARGKRLSEGSLRTIGSSSRSTRSASPAKSGAEVDRWAVLAGINGND